MIVKSNPDTVWADTTVFTVGSEKCIPLNMLTSGKGAAIYYTPKDSGKLSNTDALRKKNCLKYSISARNKKDYAYISCAKWFVFSILMEESYFAKIVCNCVSVI